MGKGVRLVAKKLVGYEWTSKAEAIGLFGGSRYANSRQLTLSGL